MGANPTGVDSNGAHAALNTAELLSLYRAGDVEALQRLCALYYPRVERIVRVRMGPALRARETVADVVQDVFVRVVEGVDGYEPRDDANWIDWVARAAQNEIANHARRDRALNRGGAAAAIVSAHATVSAANVIDDTASVGSTVARRELIELADRCLSELAEPQREVILLRDYAGMDWRSITEQMNRPSVGACQELHRRARRELAERVQRRV